MTLNRDKTGLMQQRVGELNAKLEGICKDLGKLGAKKVLTRDLQQVLDDLSRLEIDFSYELEEIKALSDDATKVLEAAKALQEENRKHKIQEASGHLAALSDNLESLEAKQAECEAKLEEY